MKLLSRTIRSYILYSTLLVLVCTPLFYFSIQYIVVSEMDKVLASHKQDFQQSLLYLKSKDELEFFPLMNKEFILRPSTKWPITDSIFSIDVRDSASGKTTPHRVFRTGVFLQGKKYELQIRESMVSNTALIGSIMTVQIVMLALMLTGLVIINRNLSRKIWKPFYVILYQLKHFNLDKDKKIDFPISSTHEFRELTAAMDQLIKRNKEVYQNQKEFTDNAAHELQTPLAICRTKLELLAQTRELTREQAELVESLLEATDRIARLNKNLLLLARIESRQFMDVTEVDVAAIGDKTLRAFSHQIEEKSLRVESSFEIGANVTANATIVEILFNNLISNAVRHSTPGGTVSIAGSRRSILIRNTGDKLENPEKLFERFQRNNKTSPIGNGLGLSILKKICDTYGYDIRYDFDRGIHSFEVIFGKT